MVIEIERRFLVVSGAWRDDARGGVLLRQGYLARTSRGVVRVRRDAVSANLTVKSVRRGILRDEFTYAIPLADADHMLEKLTIAPVIEKLRYEVGHAGKTWQVDVYAGASEGITTAEIELKRPDEPFIMPVWAGEEITHDPHYSNFAIALATLRRATAPA